MSSSGGGSVGRAVTSDTRGQRFESSHRQNIKWNIVTDNCIEKMKIQKNGRQWPIKTLKQLLKFLNGKAEADSRRGAIHFLTSFY